MAFRDPLFLRWSINGQDMSNDALEKSDVGAFGTTNDDFRPELRTSVTIPLIK
jgi:hypothetical protein